MELEAKTRELLDAVQKLEQHRHDAFTLKARLVKLARDLIEEVEGQPAPRTAGVRLVGTPTKSKTSEPTVSVRAAAQLLGVSPQCVHKWISRGQLRAHRYIDRGQYRIPLSEVERLVACPDHTVHSGYGS